MSLNNMIPRQTTFHMDKINKELTIYREMCLNNLEIQIGATIVCPANLGFSWMQDLDWLFNPQLVLCHFIQSSQGLGQCIHLTLGL